MAKIDNMHCKLFIFITLNLFSAPSLIGQTDHAWITTGKVRARITPTGIHPDAEGGFLLESSISGQPAKNLLSHLTPWVGGVDPGYNLVLACEMNNPFLSDWQAGFRGVQNSGKVWKVTREQIAAHWADYQDDGVIDNPIFEIFAWPAKGNSFSENYNGFLMDSVSIYTEAPFIEPMDVDGEYNPEKGDFPGGIFVGDTPFFPQEIVFTPFYDNGLNALTHAKSTQFEGSLLAFTLGCQEKDFLKNTIFFELRGFHNLSPYPIDSLYFGVYADFDLGNANDDYVGCIDAENQKMAFSYNTDTLYDNVLGSNPPALGIMSFGTYFNEAGFKNFMPIYPNGFGAGTQDPTANNEFYNYLTGTWRDGVPLTSHGTGYNPQMIWPRVNAAFPDNPTKINGWSELAENNPLGNRKGIMSYGPHTLYEQALSPPIRFALTVSDKIGITKQLAHLTEIRALQQYIYNGCWDCPNPFDTLCFASLSVKEIKPTLQIAPNPTHDFLSMQTDEMDILNLVLLNTLGQKVWLEPIQLVNNQEATLSLKNLPAGIYFLHWNSKEGKHGCEKVVKN